MVLTPVSALDRRILFRRNLQLGAVKSTMDEIADADEQHSPAFVLSRLNWIYRSAFREYGCSIREVTELFEPLPHDPL